MRFARGLFSAIGAAAVLASGAASARTLNVGEGAEYPVPSKAAAVAEDGDTVSIAGGTYYDCAIWSASRLTIVGKGADTVISDVTCQGKAVFVLRGNATTIRDLTLARARVPDGNGAGIRLEAQSLTLENVRFINNQVGLLGGVTGRGEIRISDCLFEGGGVGGDRPLFAVMAGDVGLLQVDRSTIRNVKGGGINSSAAETRLTGNSISTGTGEEPAAGVQASAGALFMEDNLLSIGPVPLRQSAAVWAVGDGNVTMRHNRMVNLTGGPAIMLLDWGTGETRMDDNSVGDGDTLRVTDGYLRHRASRMAHLVLGEARVRLAPFLRPVRDWLDAATRRLAAVAGH